MIKLERALELHNLNPNKIWKAKLIEGFSTQEIDAMANLERIKMRPSGSFKFLSYLKKLKSLNISLNDVSDEEFEYYSGKKNYPNTLIKIKNVLPNLKSLNITGIHDTKMELLETAKELEYLICADTKIESLDHISGLVNLTHLDCSHNKLNTIEPIAKLTNIKFLNFSFNKIDNILPICNLINLETIAFSHTNDLMDLSPLYELPNLKNVIWDQFQSTKYYEYRSVEEFDEENKIVGVSYCWFWVSADGDGIIEDQEEFERRLELGKQLRKRFPKIGLYRGMEDFYQDDQIEF